MRVISGAQTAIFGLLCRLHPVPPGFETSETARWLVRFVLAAVVLFAANKWFVLTEPMPGDMKQHLASARVVNFIGIAVMAAYFVHRGTIARIAARLPAIVTVGRTGPMCFVGGTLGREKEKVCASVNGAGCG